MSSALNASSLEAFEDSDAFSDVPSRPSPPTAQTTEDSMSLQGLEEEEQEDTFDTFSSRLEIRPITPRSITDPSGTPRLAKCYARPLSGTAYNYSRNRSPLSKSSGHYRSRSSGALPPGLTRAHSSPAIQTSKVWEMPPSRTSSASPTVHTPPRSSQSMETEEQPAWWTGLYGGGAIDVIQEEGSNNSDMPRIVPLPLHSSMGRSSSLRRRPASPFHGNISAPQPQRPRSLHFPSTIVDTGISIGTSTPNYPRSGTSSPAPSPARYNEAYPGMRHRASNVSMSSSFSSFPSTPTSARSRSPSISSLDTIEDAPELESKAVATERAERNERLRLAAERANRRIEEEADRTPRRSSFDAPRVSTFARGRSDGRKRWSICGGEMRAELDLETIPED